MPYPILLVLGGVLLALVPGLPVVTLPPDDVFLIFFPPLLYSAGVQSSVSDLRRNLRPIGSLAIGYVVVSTLALAAIARLGIGGFSWSTAFVLGAILAPTDAVAAVAVLEHLPVPRQAATILGGEGLFNDATSLSLYQVAVAAVVSGQFSPVVAGLGFVVAIVGGVVVGLVVGKVAALIEHRLDDPTIAVVVSLLIPYAAWILAEVIGASGVLAVVTTGLYLGQTTVVRLRAGARLQGTAFWSVFTFMLEGLLFIFVGLQLRTFGTVLAAYPSPTLLADVGALLLTAILVRAVWSFGARWVEWRVAPFFHLRSPRPRWRIVAIVAWSGMRGGDSLAPALALPLTIASGAPFPRRELLIFFTFALILSTLLLQGLTLSPLIRWSGLGREETDAEEARARAQLARAALGRLESLSESPWVPTEDAAQLRAHYQHRARQARSDALEEWLHHREASRRLRREAIDAERLEALRLRDQGEIGDDVLHHLERELDLEEQSLSLEE